MKELFKILIVDDELILRNGFKYLCDWNSHGFIVVGEAANGEEALSLVPILKPHIVIVDIVMPILNGIDFTKIMNEKYPDVKIIVLSSFSEFNYVREAFKYGASDYLLKPQLKSEQLIELLIKVSSEITEKPSLEKVTKSESELLELMLLNNEIISQDLLDQFQATMKDCNYVLMRCSLQNFGVQDKSELKNKIDAVFEKELNGYHWTAYGNDRDYFVLVNLSSEMIDAFSILLRKKTDLFKREIKKIKFIVSEPFSNLDQISNVNNRVSIKLGHLFYFTDEFFIHEKAILEEYKTSLCHEFEMSRLIDFFKGFHIEEAKSYIQQYFKDVKFTRVYDEYDFKRFIQNIIYNIINTSGELGFDISVMNKNKIKLFKEIDLCSSYDEIVLQVESVLEEVGKIMDTQLEKQSSIILEKVIQYVEEHYNEDITLADIAEKLHLNYYYLSSYFKNQTSENLTTYINKVKIDKAKQLLRESNETIAHISKIVGFSDHNYFSKVFKKYVGVTPSSYRRKEISWFKK